MTEGRDEVEAAVYAVVLDVLAVEAALVPEVLLELLVDVVSHWLPTAAEAQRDIQGPRQRPSYCTQHLNHSRALVILCEDLFVFDLYHSVLFTASPNPGVSTIVSFSLTPFSSISTVCLVISTVCVIRSTGETNKHLKSAKTTCYRTNIYQTKYQIIPIKSRSFLTFSIEQLPIFVQICEKQTVDQGGLSQARLPFKQRTTNTQRVSLGVSSESKVGLRSNVC